MILFALLNIHLINYQMDPKPAHSRILLNSSIIVGFVITNLIVGLIGGIGGFVLLSNSTAKPVQAVRNALHIGSSSSLAVPVHQNITLLESSAVIDAAHKVSPSVVAISGSQQVSDYFGNSHSQQVSGGSGFIITSDGLILTNKHVVDDSREKYKVVLNDGRIFDATVQAKDTLNDLAVIKINAKDLPTAELGSSDALQVGQFVLAVGNALGEFRNSVTSGIVSAKNRSIDAGDSSSPNTERLTNLIQTDAAINPGNSGGPLVNLAGQVVGIDTAIASSGQGSGSIGVGFALPIDSVKTVIDSVRKTGQIIRPYLGVRYVPVTTELKQLNNLSVDYGVLVSRGQTPGELAVLPGSPADKAGIVENDILLDINGDHITQDSPLPDLLQKYNVGNVVSVHLLHQGKDQTVKVTLTQQAAS